MPVSGFDKSRVKVNLLLQGIVFKMQTKRRIVVFWYSFNLKNSGSIYYIMYICTCSGWDKPVLLYVIVLNFVLIITDKMHLYCISLGPLQSSV